MVNKVLSFIFICLLIITVGESVYYFVIHENNSKQKTKETAILNNSNLLPQPSIGQTNKQAISNESLYMLSRYKKDLIKKSIITNEFQGKIKDIVFEETSRVRLHIEGEGKNQNGFYLNTNDLKKLKILDKNSQPINFPGLVVGDTVIITEKIDLLIDNSQNSTIEIVIKKIN